MTMHAHHLVDGVGLWAELRIAPPVEPGPVLFLDRDGVLIEDLGYVGSAAATRLYDDAADAIAEARAKGFRVTLVTNQSGIARGYYDWSGFAEVQQIIDAALEQRGASLDAVIACAYHRDGYAPFNIDAHAWRKPKPGMILEGLILLNGLAAESVMIGDKPIDIEAARAAGLGQAVLIDRAGAHTGQAGADAIVTSLGEAVRFLSSLKK